MGIKPKQALEFIDVYIHLPISDKFATEKAAKQTGISLGNALDFIKTYYLFKE